MQTKVILADKASRTDKAQKGYKSVILEMREKRETKNKNKKKNNPKTTKRKSSPRAPEVEKKIELTTNKVTF